MQSYTTITAYIAAQPKEFQAPLRDLYALIAHEAPHATEAIKYGMPTFVGNKNLVHFALAKKHIGLYPTPSAIVHFSKELSGYNTSKGAIQFPLTTPLPKGLITKIVRFRVREDREGK
jgi:uncharacterized protein YdhG (YjbR/CyaY superfamily)